MLRTPRAIRPPEARELQRWSLHQRCNTVQHRTRQVAAFRGHSRSAGIGSGPAALPASTDGSALARGFFTRAR